MFDLVYKYLLLFSNMKKANLDFRIQVNFLREGNKFIAYTPALDLSTSGKTYKEAKERFAEAVSIFFEEIMEKGTLEDVLLDSEIIFEF